MAGFRYTAVTTPPNGLFTDVQVDLLGVSQGIYSLEVSSAASGVIGRLTLDQTNGPRLDSQLAAADFTPPPPPPPPVDPKTAPSLRVTSGNVLEWDRVGDVTSYVLVTKVPGKADVYSTVTGTAFSPTAVPGTTVKYGLRTNVTGSAWASEVSIAWAAPAPPPPPPPAPSQGVLFGFDGPTDWPERLTPALSQMGGTVKLVRLATDRLGDSAKALRTLAAIRAAGAEAVLVISDWKSSPATVRSWVDRYAIKYVELGNETFYNYSGKSTTQSLARSNAKTYATQIKAIKSNLPAGVKLLVQGDFPAYNGIEATDIKATVPDVARYIDGVTIHPYINAVTRIRAMYRHLAVLGLPDTTPIYVTEYGIATNDGVTLTDNYALPKNLTFAQAGAAVRPAYDAIRAEVRNLAVFIWFQSIDQGNVGVSGNGRELWFGLFRRDTATSPKGAFTTAVKALFSS